MSGIKIINITDTITREYAQSIINQINDACTGNILFIFINIHSNGGSVYEGFRIISAIERAKNYCIIGTIIDVIAFSTAVLIFCCGDDGYRFVSPFTQVMIHNPVTKSHKDYHHAHEESVTISGIGHLECVREQMNKIILAPLVENEELHTEFATYLEEFKNRNWFLTAEEMIYYGLANHMFVPDLITSDII